jgi:hypothetical protein
MTEASWGDASKSPPIDWSMSASLENVVRNDQDIAEVANLEGVVREWLKLDPEHQAAAILSVERPIILDGASHDSLSSDGIAMLAERLPTES